MRMFRFINLISGGYNHNFLLEELADPAKLWVGKICKPVNGFTDLDSRHLIACELASLLGIPLVPAETISAGQIANLEEIYAQYPTLKGLESLRVSEHKGVNLAQFIQQGGDVGQMSNLEQVFQSWAFNLWIGNHDRKDTDYIIDEKSFCWFIDYDLSGIGFEDPRPIGFGELNLLVASLGANAKPYLFESLETIIYCVCWHTLENCSILLRRLTKLSKEKRYEKLEPMVKQISQLSEDEIENVVNKYPLFRQNSNGKIRINDEYVEVLLARRHRLEDILEQWCQALPDC